MGCGRVYSIVPNCARCREFSRGMRGDVYFMYSIWAVHGSITCALFMANKELRSDYRLLHGGGRRNNTASMLMRKAERISIGKTPRE